MRGANKLSALKVTKLTKPGRYGDGGGLWLQVTSAGTKSWLLRFMLDGKARHMGLGPLELVPLAEARQKALEARRLLLGGTDPIEARKATKTASKLQAARAETFRSCAERYIAAHSAGWRNRKHRAQWPATLKEYAYPVIGDLPVAAVDTQLVLKILEPVWNARPETASRTRGRIEAVLSWAAARGFRTGENPARWRGHLDKLLPARSKIAPVKHHAAMPYPDMPAFMAELRQQPDISARALEFTILTAARTGEALNASWQEIDLGAKLWVVPAERMKSRRAHRVPLSEAAVRVLEHLPRLNDSDYVFPSGRIGKPLSDKAMPKIMRRLRLGYVPHGFRSTFRDWAAEQTNYPREIAEAALAHVIENRVEAAYRRGDALEKRAALMADWADFCGEKPVLTAHPVGSSAYLRALATSRKAPKRAATN